MKLKFLTLAAAALAFTSCTLTEMPSAEQEEVAVQTLVANLPSSATTRVSYTDNLTDDAGSIDLAWQDGDTFSVKVDDGTNPSPCAKFQYSVDGKCFKQINNGANGIVPLEDDVSYVATTERTSNTGTQTANDDISHLTGIVTMTAKFTYSKDAELDFYHTYALMRFKFKAESEPKTLSFKSTANGNPVVLKFGENVEAGEVTAYMGVPAVNQGDRKVVLLLTCEDGEYIFSANVSMAYEAGKCYVANVTFDKKAADEETTVEASYFDSNTTLSSGNIIVNGEPTVNQFKNLKTAINSYSGSVNLTMPDITEIPTQFINTSTTIASFSGAKVKTVGASAFSGSSIGSFDLPLVTTIGKQAFNNCKNLTTCDLSSVTEIGQSAFAACSKITDVYAPKVSIIGVQAFNSCTAIVKMTITTDPSVTNLTFIKGNPIISGAKDTDIALYTNYDGNGTTVNGAIWTVKDSDGGTKEYTFGSITQQAD